MVSKYTKQIFARRRKVWNADGMQSADRTLEMVLTVQIKLGVLFSKPTTFITETEYISRVVYNIRDSTMKK